METKIFQNEESIQASIKDHQNAGFTVNETESLKQSEERQNQCAVLERGKQQICFLIEYQTYEND